MKHSQSKAGPDKPLSQRIVPAALLAVVVVGLAMLVWLNLPKTESSVTPAAAPSSEPVHAAVKEQEPNFKPLLGNWLREDGGYRLELESVESDGQLNAAYFNPRPINVSFAKATNDAGTLRIRVELNDVGYPGCVYSLVHDRANDRLIGTYFQAAMHETYEVMFVRLPRQ